MKCVGVGFPEVLTDADMVIPGFQRFNLSKLKEI